MPEQVKLPEHGEIYEAVEEFAITYKTIYRTSFSGSGKARFPAGERLVVDTRGRKNINVYCDAVNYELLEDQIVPEKTRTSLSYNGYYFHFSIKTLRKHCRKVTVL